MTEFNKLSQKLPRKLPLLIIERFVVFKIEWSMYLNFTTNFHSKPFFSSRKSIVQFYKMFWDSWTIFFTYRKSHAWAYQIFLETSYFMNISYFIKSNAYLFFLENYNSLNLYVYRLENQMLYFFKANFH